MSTEPAPRSIRTAAVADAVHTVTLNRPERRNALSASLLEHLFQVLQTLRHASSCRVVVLEGAGPCFCSGLDLADLADPERAAGSARSLAAVLQEIRQSPLVFLASVHGDAWAGGAALMATCDIVLAADSARIAFPAAHRGLLPSLILDVVRQRLSAGALNDLFLTGQPVDAHTAQRIGLVERVVTEQTLAEQTLRTAQAVTAGAPETIRQTKRLLRDTTARTPTDASDCDPVRQHLDGRNSQEAQEGIRAFLEKRPPWWSS